VGQGFGPASRASARLFRAEARNAARKGCPTSRLAAENRDFERRMTEYAADVKDSIRRLANIARAHDDREHRLDNPES